MTFKENLNIPQLLLLSSFQDGNKYCQKEMQSNILSFNASAVPLFYIFIAVGNGLLASSSFVSYTWLFFCLFCDSHSQLFKHIFLLHLI